MKKVWIVTEFVDGSQYENSNLPKGMKLPVSCEIFSKEKRTNIFIKKIYL